MSSFVDEQLLFASKCASRRLFTDNRSCLNVMLLNVRSLLQVSDEVSALLTEENLDLCVVCENWLEESARF